MGRRPRSATDRPPPTTVRSTPRSRTDAPNAVIAPIIDETEVRGGAVFPPPTSVPSRPTVPAQTVTGDAVIDRGRAAVAAPGPLPGPAPALVPGPAATVPAPAVPGSPAWAPATAPTARGDAVRGAAVPAAAVAAISSPGALAQTGLDTSLVLGLATVVLLVGAALLFVTRPTPRRT